jgi:hypothetical protein
MDSGAVRGVLPAAACFCGCGVVAVCCLRCACCCVVAVSSWYRGHVRQDMLAKVRDVLLKAVYLPEPEQGPRTAFDVETYYRMVRAPAPCPCRAIPSPPCWCALMFVRCVVSPWCVSCVCVFCSGRTSTALHRGIASVRCSDRLFST